MWATEVSNLICSPHFRSSVSRKRKKIAFAFDVPTRMLLFYQSSGHSIFSSFLPGKNFLLREKNFSFSKEESFPPTCFLDPVHMLNTFPLCLTAAAGTEFARDFVFFSFKHKNKKGFQHVAFINFDWKLFFHTSYRNA